MEIRRLFLTENACYKKGQTITPKGIMIHSTGANNPNLRRYLAPNDGLLGENRYDNHWNQGNISKCVHAFIGRLADGTVACYQTLPWNHRGWHCGKNGNDTHISIEICEDDLTGSDYFKTVYAMAVALCTYLCREFGFDPLAPGVLIDHDEGHALGIASNHNDVGYWFKRFGRTMDDFRADVAKMVQEESSGVKENLTALVDTAVEAAVGKHYETLGEVPTMYRPMLDKLVEKGFLIGRAGQGENLVIDLRENDVRALVIMARALEEAGLLCPVP